MRAQQKLFELTRASSPGGATSAEITLSQDEINAFLDRHLAEAGGLALGTPRVAVEQGRVEVSGHLTLGELLGEPTLADLGQALPASWRRLSLWLHIRARATVERPHGRRGTYLRLRVERFAVGAQRLPAVLLRVLLSPSALRLLQWPLPDAVETLVLEPGRVVIQTAASPARSGAEDRR